MNIFQKEYSDIYDLSLISSFRIFSNKITSFREKIINSTNFSENDKYMIVNDLDVLIENIKNYNMSKNSDSKNVTDFLNDFTMGKTINFKQDGISLLTIHKSKGLEFQVVFFIGLSEGVLPDYRANTEDKLSEEKNNVFVGLSRSKRDLYLSSVKNKMMPWGKLKKQVESRYLEVIRKSIESDEVL